MLAICLSHILMHVSLLLLLLSSSLSFPLSLHMCVCVHMHTHIYIPGVTTHHVCNILSVRNKVTDPTHTHSISSKRLRSDPIHIKKEEIIQSITPGHRDHGKHLRSLPITDNQYLLLFEDIKFQVISYAAIDN